MSPLVSLCLSLARLARRVSGGRRRPLTPLITPSSTVEAGPARTPRREPRLEATPPRRAVALAPPTPIPVPRTRPVLAAAGPRLVPATAAPAPTPANDTTQTAPRNIALALQGGGAHGAFTWGVLDRLLDQPDLNVRAISGTSAGAMNAVVLAHGLIQGGRDGARLALRTYWHEVARAGRLSPFQRSWLDRLSGGWSLDRSPWMAAMGLARQFVSPYQSNPLGLNPLQEILDGLVDFAALRRQSDIALYVGATNVNSGQAAVFTTETLDARRVMASACLPSLFQAVQIDGVPYWDGGYVSNPPLLPLIGHEGLSDLVVVPITPHFRAGTPQTARDIVERANEITFNASLNQGLETVSRINGLLDSGQLDENPFHRLWLHVIDADDEFNRLEASSRGNTEWAFLDYLHDLGHRTADKWLARNGALLGHADSAANPTAQWAKVAL